MTNKQKKVVKLSKIERALLLLGEHIERCPYNVYKVREEIMDALGIEFIPDKHSKR